MEAASLACTVHPLKFPEIDKTKTFFGVLSGVIGGIKKIEITKG